MVNGYFAIGDCCLRRTALPGYTVAIMLTSQERAVGRRVSPAWPLLGFGGYLITSIFYVFPSGTPQPADYLLVLVIATTMLGAFLGLVYAQRRHARPAAIEPACTSPRADPFASRAPDPPQATPSLPAAHRP